MQLYAIIICVGLKFSFWEASHKHIAPVQSLRLNLRIFVRKLWNEVHESFPEVWHTKKAIITWIRSRATILWYSFCRSKYLRNNKNVFTNIPKQQHLEHSKRAKLEGNGEFCAARCPRNPACRPPKRCMLLSAGWALDGWRDLVEIIEPRFMKIWPYQCWADHFLIFRPLQSNMNCGGENPLRLWQFFRKCCLFSNQIWFKKVRV